MDLQHEILQYLCLFTIIQSKIPYLIYCHFNIDSNITRNTFFFFKGSKVF